MDWGRNNSAVQLQPLVLQTEVQIFQERLLSTEVEREIFKKCCLIRISYDILRGPMFSSNFANYLNSWLTLPLYNCRSCWRCVDSGDSWSMQSNHFPEFYIYAL